MQHWKKGTYISFMAFIVPVDRKKQWLGQPGCSLSGSGFPPACPERPHKWENGWTFSLAEQRSHEDSSVITCHWCWTLPGSNWRETLPAALLGALLNWDQVQFNLVYAKEMLNENYSWSYRKYLLVIFPPVFGDSSWFFFPSLDEYNHLFFAPWDTIKRAIPDHPLRKPGPAGSTAWVLEPLQVCVFLALWLVAEKT